MTAQVPALTIVFCTVSCILAFAIPIALMLYLRIKKHADILPFFIGCAVMLVFALILESIVHNIVLNSASGRKILDNIWLYALYGGMMAGLFEETGRFIAFKTVLRKKNSNDANALMYGAGHGGFEAIVLLGFSMISNIAMAVMINRGNISAITGVLPEDALAQVQPVIDQLVSSSPYLFIAGNERKENPALACRNTHPCGGRRHHGNSFPLFVFSSHNRSVHRSNDIAGSFRRSKCLA